MSSVYPHQPSIDHSPRNRTDVVVSGDDPGEVLCALSSSTARAIIGTLGDEPATASTLAEDVDTSLQNAHYHLEALCDADLVERVETWYSAKGTEMTVYALAAERLVVSFGSGDGLGARADGPAGSGDDVVRDPGGHAEVEP